MQAARLPLYCLVLVLLSACGTKASEVDTSSFANVVDPKLERRFDEVRAIHDEVMPDRGKLIRLQRTIEKSDLEPADAAFAKTRLERADDMMMDWMYADKSLVTLLDSLENDQISQFLDKREVQIQAVADSMRTAIKYADLILAQ